MAKCVDCKKGCEAAIKDIENAWRCPISGIWVYRQLPEGMRFAVRNDINPDGRRLIGLKYLLKGYLSDNYEAYTLNDYTDLPNLIRFIDDNKCWIKI